MKAAYDKIIKSKIDSLLEPPEHLRLDTGDMWLDIEERIQKRKPLISIGYLRAAACILAIAGAAVTYIVLLNREKAPSQNSLAKNSSIRKDTLAANPAKDTAAPSNFIVKEYKSHNPIQSDSSSVAKQLKTPDQTIPYDLVTRDSGDSLTSPIDTVVPQLLSINNTIVQNIPPEIQIEKSLLQNLKPHNVNRASQDLEERKVDYLEWIYFSGESKEGLNTKILIACQQMQELRPTPALSKQMNFLVEIKEQAEAADNACDILDLLAVGIYNIDAAEAMAQGVKPPNDKAKKKSVDALASLDKLTNTSNTLSGSARNLEWSSWILNNGKYRSFDRNIGWLVNTAETTGAVEGIARTANAMGGIAKGLGIGGGKKKKPCDDVPKKDIVLGQHAIAPATIAATQLTASNGSSTELQSDAAISSAAGTEIIINNVTYEQLSSLITALRKTSGITSVNDDNFSSNIATLMVNHKMSSVGELIDKIKLAASFNLKVLSRGKYNAVLEIKN